MYLKSFALVVLLLAAPLLQAAAPQAILSSLKGKVEVKLAGTTAWVPAVEGQVLSPASTLSTGFDSTVVVVMDKTTVQVKPLTRMTIDKLVEESGTVKTTTFLRVGSVSASVKSAEGVKQDFKVQSPYSTASVRGTEFDFDGLKLKVREGLVAFILGRSDRDGEASENDFVGAPEQAASDKEVPVGAGQEAEITVDFTGGQSTTGGTNDKDKFKAEAGTDTPAAGQTAAPNKGTVTVKVTFSKN